MLDRATLHKRLRCQLSLSDPANPPPAPTPAKNNTSPYIHTWDCRFTLTAFPLSQKKANSKSGSEMQRDKEAVAALMREKQKKGTFPSPFQRLQGLAHANSFVSSCS